MYLSKLTDTRYQCSTPRCSPSTVVSTSNIQNCEIACLDNEQCRTVTFDSNTHQCEMFLDIPSKDGSLSINLGSITMIAEGERELSARK